MSLAPHSDDATIAALAERLAHAPHIALDTEFLRERTYRPQLCLLQFAIPGEACCVDPLARVSLTPLVAALQNPAIPKIVHAARQDLEVLWPVFGAVAPVFDTQVAASLTGMPTQIGYGELVRRILGVELAKAETRTDWSRRPLSEAQLQYAVDDVLHLAALRDALAEKLDRLGRSAWLAEDLHDIGAPEKLFVDPEKAWQRLKWSGELDTDRTRLLQRLAAWRERRAAERDRPRTWILEDAGLRSLVMRPPRTASDLAALADLTPGFVERSGAQLLQIVSESDLPPNLPPPAQRVKPDAQFMASVKRLGNLVQDMARELAISPEILAARRDLESIARGEDISDSLRGWRLDVVGKALLAAR
jgi:ribonuclease D